MKEIKAVIKTNMVDPVLEALMVIPDLPGVTISQVEGFGRRSGGGADAPPGSYSFARKTKLELVVRDDLAGAIVAAIQQAAHTGQPDDGKIFVVEVTTAVRICTGDRNDDAL